MLQIFRDISFVSIFASIFYIKQKIFEKVEYVVLFWPEWFTSSKHVFMDLLVQSTMHYSQLGTVDWTSKTDLHWDFTRFAQKIKTKLRQIFCFKKNPQQ